MYELIKINSNTYVINSPSKVVYHKGYLFDSSNDKEGVKKVLKALEEAMLPIKEIINTHSNADHIGGNKYLNDKYKISSSKGEKPFIENTLLEPSLLYGGYPFKEIQNKFLMADNSSIDELQNNNDFEVIDLKGHFINMIGFKLDNVYFLADSLMGENILNKYHITFLYDIKSQFETLDYIEKLEGETFILSHAEILKDIKPLVKLNRDKMNEIIKLILNICEEKRSFDYILKSLFDNYNLKMDFNQYILISSTLRSYLSYLKDNSKIDFIIDENILYYKRV